MGTISQNQYDYLNNLANAGGGNGEWAKSQLQGATVEKPISQNQYSYLSNLSSQGGGNGEWAKSQLQGTTVAPTPTPAPAPSPAPTFTPIATQQTGHNVTNYNPNSSPQKQVADLGQAWVNAYNKGASQSELDAIHQQAATIGAANGGSYDSKGVWTFAPQKPAPAPAPGPAPTPAPNNSSSPYTPPAQNSTNFKNEMSDLIAKQTAAQYAAQLAKLQALRDTQLLGLAGQSTLANQNADGQANKASAANAVAAQRLKERMASMGLLDSGYNLANMSDLNAQRQSDLGSIEQQRANNLQAITEQRAQIQDAAAKGDLGLLQELQAKQAQQLIDLGYNVDTRDFRDRQFGWNQTMDQANLTGDYNGNRTLAGSAQDWGKTVDTANLTGQFNGQNTMAGKQANWNAAKDVWDASGHMVNPQSDWQGLLNQANSGNTPLTQAAQQTKINNLWQSAQQTGFISNELADTVGLPRGTATLDAQRLLLQQDQNAQGWAGLDIKQVSAANSSHNTLFTAGQLMNNIQDGLVTKTTVWDATQGQYVTQSTPITDSNSRYGVYKQTILSGNGFTDTQMDAILAAGGFTPAEISAYQAKLSKEYGLGG